LAHDPSPKSVQLFGVTCEARLVRDSGKVYRNKSLSLDGKHFEACTFDRCTLDYGGGIPPVLTGCAFENCSFSFSGEAAYTLAFLSGMHSGGFSAIVEQTFQSIRDGTFLSIPVQDLDPKQPAQIPADAHPLTSRTPRIVQIPKRTDN
jgi:hypothetical protein